MGWFDEDVDKSKEVGKNTQSKSEDYYSVQGNYGSGFEEVTAEEQYSEAKNRLKEYEENEPQYTHRIVTKKGEL